MFGHGGYASNSLGFAGLHACLWLYWVRSVSLTLDLMVHSVPYRSCLASSLCSAAAWVGGFIPVGSRSANEPVKNELRHGLQADLPNQRTADLTLIRR